jgi:hypothetical protein
MGAIRKRTCKACGTEQEVLVHHQHGTTSLTNKDCDDLLCPNPECRSDQYVEGFDTRFAPARDEVVDGKVRYPYFDPNLGVTFDSAAHKRRYLRENGLVEMEGEMGTEMEKQRAHEERVTAHLQSEFDAYQRDVQADPDLRAAQARFDRISREARDPAEVRRLFYGRD